MQFVADGCTGGLDGVRTCVGDLLQLHCHTLGSPPTSLSFHLTLSPTLLSFFCSHFHTFSVSLLVRALLYFLDGSPIERVLPQCECG